MSRSASLLILLVLMVVGGWLRGRYVASHPLWFDEADSWRSGIIDPNPPEMWWDQQSGQFNPPPMGYVRFFQWTNHFETAPFSFLVERISTDLLGTTAEWAMRLPSLIAGILCIPAMFMFGCVVHSRGAGVMAAALTAFDPNFVDQSQQARMYMVMALFVILALVLAIRLMRRPDALLCSLAPGSAGERAGVRGSCTTSDATLTQAATAPLSGEINAATNPSAEPPHPNPLPRRAGGEGTGACTATSNDCCAANLWQWLALGTLFGLMLACSQFTTCIWIGVALAAGLLVVGGKLTGQPHPQTLRLLSSLTAAYLVGLMLTNVGVFGIVNRVIFGGEGDGAHLTRGEIFREIVVAAKDLINLTPAGLVVYVIAAAGIVVLYRRCKTSAVVLACIIIVNFLVLFPFRRMHHFLDGRYLTSMQPALLMALAVFAVGFKAKLLRNLAMGVVIAYLVLQTWQSVAIERYYPQPDRYLFPQRIIAVRDQMKPGERMSIYPGVAVILGQYYRVPQDRALFEGLYYPFEQLPREKQEVPAGVKDRCPATWMVLGMYNYEDGKQKQKRIDTINLIANHYGVKADAAELDKHIQQRRITTLRISIAGVEVSSVGLGDAK